MSWRTLVPILRPVHQGQAIPFALIGVAAVYVLKPWQAFAHSCTVLSHLALRVQTTGRGQEAGTWVLCGGIGSQAEVGSQVQADQTVEKDDGHWKTSPP